MKHKLIEGFSAEQIEEARLRYAQMPKKPIVDMTQVMSTPEGRQRVQEGLDYVLREHALAFKILKDH
ncbi:hypothetical protein KQH49_06650 [Mycetohabitans sp. B5]|uniref:Uncharacterized protein n=1 Tax=Mycetohabitans endofungorum TaxID=417203 RepID=A0A2P5KA71_9BURK|nr:MULTISPECIES: hypothetical protein [Burkholderiaceae]MCG1017930.1 hypothetical protein [Mycetohabitans sp. B4]MCG1054648.1 hypothetical protein [Mycetohabitans sp. B5]PPB83607.1 hypothetical protein B0O95_107123 [Mycetohabitans endofungorum]SIT66039.1 hypothetical protein SAMN04487768_0705 [Burkholderia sp. b13]SIT75779.1 hypothetical protein SAMN04487768_3271 [Burkholderia sp. b13]